MKKPRFWILGITICFLILLFGIFLGRTSRADHLLKPSIQVSENSTETVNPHRGKIDINSADIYQLTLLPGIGKTLAERILAYRTESGGFHSLEELMEVEGIGMKKYEQIKDFIFLGGSNENISG